MAWNFFQCICGRFASINIFAWLSWPKIIECECGRRLKVYNQQTAHHDWYKYMRSLTACEEKNGTGNS